MPCNQKTLCKLIHISLIALSVWGKSGGNRHAVRLVTPVAATLIIDRAIDLPVDEETAAMEAAFGMTTGDQYIEGTFNISLIPMESQGEQFEPEIFEFGATTEWGYNKALHGSK